MKKGFKVCWVVLLVVLCFVGCTGTRTVLYLDADAQVRKEMLFRQEGRVHVTYRMETEPDR